MTASQLRVYIACSLDGFIAGANDDLSWLPGADGSPVGGPARDPGAVGYEEFMADVGALLMGRRTYDVVSGFPGAWPYGQRPVLVASHRPLASMKGKSVGVAGDIHELIQTAKVAAGEKDVYIDGGDLIRQALDAELVDDLIVTLVPVVLGAGQPLFAGVRKRHRFEFSGHYNFEGGLVQLRARPLRDHSEV